MDSALDGLNKTLLKMNVESGTAVEIADKYFNFKYFAVSLGFVSFTIVAVVVCFVGYKICKPIVEYMLENV